MKSATSLSLIVVFFFFCLYVIRLPVLLLVYPTTVTQREGKQHFRSLSAKKTVKQGKISPVVKTGAEAQRSLGRRHPRLLPLPNIKLSYIYVGEPFPTSFTYQKKRYLCQRKKTPPQKDLRGVFDG